MTQLVTIEDVKKAIPSKKHTITQQTIDIINGTLNEPEFQGESVLDVASTYEAVIKRATRSNVEDYVCAIRFCAYLTTNKAKYYEAYARAFSHREFVQKRVNLPNDSVGHGELRKAASRYRQNRLVVDLLTISQVPLDMMFAGKRYKALGVLADVMENGRYDRDKVAAAKELLAATKGPEHIKMELEVGTVENSAIDQLNDQLAGIASRSLKHLEAGSTSLSELGALKVKDDSILEGELVDAK